MARRKKGTPVHGWLILDKSGGQTSTQALGSVKRMLDAQKAGHAGTLDPLATGILPLAFGEATKTVSFVVDGAKAYRFEVRWGAETDTDDAEGRVVRTSAERPSRAAIVAALPRFVGEIQQKPPQFSAVKIDGNRAYDLAREGAEVDIAPRPVAIDSLDLVDMPGPDAAIFAAECGKGTYVRALARDIGRLLGCLGHVTALRRTAVGPFGEDDAVTLDELNAILEKDGREGLLGLLLPIEAALDDVPALAVSPADAATLARGQSILIRGRDAPIISGAVYATVKGRIIALGEIEKGALKPTRVFNLTLV
jgi:tRNA pseudouridine55 synthase